MSGTQQQHREAEHAQDRVAGGVQPKPLPLPGPRPPGPGERSPGRNFDDGPGDAEQIAARKEYEQAKKADAQREAIRRAEDRGDWDRGGRFVRSSWSVT